MWAGAGKIKFGIYACSPEDSSFKAVFTDMKLTECQWKAHDVKSRMKCSSVAECKSFTVSKFVEIQKFNNEM